jgi:hypothetical protein
MKRKTRVIKVATMLAIAACALAATASSAFATISIEPVSTAFKGSPESVTVHTGASEWGCTRGSEYLKGTTQPSKLDYVNVTPTIAKCETMFGGGLWTMTFSNSCTKEGTVPWTLTLTEGTGPYQGSVKLNCALTVNIDEGGCVISVLEQTLNKSLRWSSFASGSDLTLDLTNMKYKATKYGFACELAGLKKEGEDFSLEAEGIELKGIKAT